MNKHAFSSIQQLDAALTAEAQQKVDFIADTRSLGFVACAEQAAIVVQPGSSEPTIAKLTPHAFGQLASQIKLPKTYADRMLTDAPQLLERNVIHWLTEEPTRRMVRMLQKPSGVVCRAWLSDRYQRIENSDIARAVLSALRGVDSPVELRSATLTDNKMTLQFSFPALRAEVAVGDEVEAGFTVANSETGSGAFTIGPFIYRAFCLNGLVISERGLRRSHLGRRHDSDGVIQYSDDTRKMEDELIVSRVRDAVRTFAQRETFDEIVAAMREAKRGPTVRDPIAAVELLSNSFSLTKSEQSSVLEGFIADRDYSRWGILNAVTAVNNSCDDVDRGYELQQLGGQILAMPQKEWATIAS